MGRLVSGAADDDLYSDRNMKKPRSEVGTAPSEFEPPSRETPYIPDPDLPSVMHRAALAYPYDPDAVDMKRVR